jgi:hypothetical protein
VYAGAVVVVTKRPPGAAITPCRLSPGQWRTPPPSPCLPAAGPALLGGAGGGSCTSSGLKVPRPRFLPPAAAAGGGGGPAAAGGARGMPGAAGITPPDPRVAYRPWHMPPPAAAAAAAAAPGVQGGGCRAGGWCGGPGSHHAAATGCLAAPGGSGSGGMSRGGLPVAIMPAGCKGSPGTGLLQARWSNLSR